MKRQRYIYLLAEAIILAAVALLAFTALKQEYLFGWLAHNWSFYLLLSLIALLLNLFKKDIVSIFMTAGIAVAVFVGNYLGKYIVMLNEGKITEDMRAEDIWRLRHHPGFELWIAMNFVFLVAGVLVQLFFARKIKKSAL